ncbi:hypothetical protein PLICRDRAFT_325110 [Plicaturopsis crispa FD-325 SS-3]|nr:hypothetical protein PLICRDRAFT_325110 [Plicaturopsis crispa FD-325 SS-3]
MGLCLHLVGLLIGVREILGQCVPLQTSIYRNKSCRCGVSTKHAYLFLQIRMRSLCSWTPTIAPSDTSATRIDILRTRGDKSIGYEYCKRSRRRLSQSACPASAFTRLFTVCSISVHRISHSSRLFLSPNTSDTHLGFLA